MNIFAFCELLLQRFSPQYLSVDNTVKQIKTECIGEASGLIAYGFLDQGNSY